MSHAFRQNGWDNQPPATGKYYVAKRVAPSEKVPPRRNAEKCRDLEREIATMALSGTPALSPRERAAWISQCHEAVLHRSVVYAFSNGRIVDL